MTTITLGFSPCPNDTFLFYPLLHGLVETGRFSFQERLEDVETLNRLALEGALDVCKVSCHAFAFLRDRYVLLRSGGAMGRGCGPLVISRDPMGPHDLRGKRVAAPGRHTTALLLFNLLQAEPAEIVFLPFHEIMGAIAGGRIDAGIIIHESRFTFRNHGLRQVIDLGEWWERSTGLPIPLGGIAARRSLGTETLSSLNALLRNSVSYSLSHPSEAVPYVRAHSREMSDEVCAAHIGLYVNEYSLDPGDEGEKGMETLFAMGERAGLFPRRETNIYLPRQ